MKYVFIVLVLMTLPMLVAFLNGTPQRRPWAMAAIAFLLFLSDDFKINAWLISWPTWQGTIRGMQVSPADTLALALLLTRRKTPGARPFWGLLAFYGVVLASSLFVSAVPMATFFACWQFGRMLLMFAAIAGECHRPEMRKGLLAGIALGLIFQASYVVFEKLHGVVQAAGTFPHQNILGLLTELALMPLLAALLGGDRRKLIMLGVVAGLIIVAGGGSRGSIGFAGGGIVVLGVLSLARGVTPAKTSVAAIGALAFVVFGALSYMTLKERFGNYSMVVEETQRQALTRAAEAMAADHPLGVGANMFVSVTNTQGYAARGGVSWNWENRSKPVHNAYLLARAETGWLGEFAFILLLVVPFYKGLRFAFRRRQGLSGEVALGSAVALGLNMVHNNYEFATFYYNVFGMLTINLGLIASVLWAAAHAPRPRPKLDLTRAMQMRPTLAT